MRRFITAHALDLGLVFVVVVWGFSPTIFKVALEEVQPLTFVLLRFLLLSAVSVAALLFQARRTGRPAFRIPRGDLWPLIISGLSGYGIYQLFYIEGLSHTTAFAASLFTATVPLWSAGLLALLRIERIRPAQWAGIVISFAGIVWFLAASHTTVSEAPADRALTPAGVLLGNALSLAGAALFALYGVVNKRLAPRYTAAELMCYTLLIGTVALLPFGLASVAHQDWSHVTWRFWVILPYSVLFPIYITYSIWNWAIGERGVGYVTLYNYAVPVLGGVFAFIFLGEALTPAQGVSAAVVLGGMLLARWAIIRHESRRRRAGAAQVARGVSDAERLAPVSDTPAHEVMD